MRTHRIPPLPSILIAVACVCTPAIAGTLTGLRTTAPSTVNLTAEGTLDWVHWGLNTEADFDRKSSGSNPISNYTPITGPVANNTVRFDDAAIAFSWTDGAPTETAVLSTTGLYVAGLTNGFLFTVQAGIELRELKVYLGAWNARVHFEATLSDASAPAYLNEDVDDLGDAVAAAYTLRFAANSAGQTLTIKVYSSALHDPSGNCTLMAATLGTPATGTLNGSATFLPNGAAVNLTQEGTQDWAHWGLTTETSFNHKSSVTSKITNVTPLGGGVASPLANSPVAYVWTDGTPTATSSNASGISMTGEGTGFQFSVPADTTVNTLRVYVTAYSARVHFQAALSDGSVPPWIDDSFDATPDQQGPTRVYIVTYAAAAAAQTLNVMCSVLVDEGAGWVGLSAATLQSTPAQTGILGGGYTVLAAASTVNLTAEGRIDWAHWGIVEATDVDRKAGGTNVISDFQVIGVDQGGGPLELVEFNDNFTAYSWTDGSPTTNAVSSGTGIWLAQPGVTAGPGLNSGFELTVPADTSVRALKVYVGAYGCRMHFEARLSDGSAPPFVDESFSNESDGPNRVYTLSFAAASAGQRLIVRWWILDLADEEFGNVTLQSAVLREAAPIVSLASPANGSIFNVAAAGLRFTASTIDPFSIDPGQLGLVLNGSDVSSRLVVTGNATARSAAYTNLAPNQSYTGLIRAIDNLGHGTTNFIAFDTFSTNGPVVIESEDYNHDAGQFIDYATPGAYADLPATPDVDYYSVNAFFNQYRPEPLQIVVAVETRPYFTAAGVDNYAVADWNVDDWLNYTRTFPAARYRAYLRYGALIDQSVQLNLVTGNRTQPNQTVSPLGLFNAPPINTTALYRYAPLTDSSSNLVTVALSGMQTLRLTGVNVSAGGLVADFLIFVPTADEPPQLRIATGPNQITLSFPTQPGLTYTLQRKQALDTSPWLDISPPVIGDGTEKSVNQPLDQPSQFYRLNSQ